MNKFYASALGLMISLPAIAEKTEKPLQAELELGILLTSGNTETQTYKGKLDVTHDLENWKNHYILEALFKSDELEDENGDEQETTTAEKYFASAQADYKLNKEHAALFVYAEYDRNRFSGFDYQYTVAAGYTDRLFTFDNSFLSYDIGPGMSVDKPEAEEGEDSVDSEETFIIRFSAEYQYDFSENAKFTQSVASNYSTDSEKNTKTKSVTAVTAKLNSKLALKASYTFDYNTEIPEDREHADGETAITVVYSF